MNLLLDTHIWVWSLSQPQKLHRRVAAAMRHDDAQLWLSPVSIWEFLLLALADRLSIEGDPFEWVNTALERLPTHQAPFTNDVAIETARLNLPHRDPADRFLAATARVFDLTLVTSDRRLIEAPGLSILSNR